MPLSPTETSPTESPQLSQSRANEEPQLQFLSQPIYRFAEQFRSSTRTTFSAAVKRNPNAGQTAVERASDYSMEYSLEYSRVYFANNIQLND